MQHQYVSKMFAVATIDKRPVKSYMKTCLKEDLYLLRVELSRWLKAKVLLKPVVWKNVLVAPVNLCYTCLYPWNLSVFTRQTPFKSHTKAATHHTDCWVLAGQDKYCTYTQLSCTPSALTWRIYGCVSVCVLCTTACVTSLSLANTQVTWVKLCPQTGCVGAKSEQVVLSAARPYVGHMSSISWR